MLEYLQDRARYATLDRDAVAVLCDAVAERGIVPAAFTLAKIERFECGGAAHWMAVYHHAKTGLDFSLIPGGTFVMGSPESEVGRFPEETQHEVTLTQPFLMCQTPCTQAAWSRGGRRKNVSKFSGDALPVERVSWKFTAMWCKTAGLMLPTEAQWEHACRAGTTGPFCFGDSLDASMANFNGESPHGSGAVGEFREKTTPVTMFRPNAFGLWDLHGNVWEWCADWNGDYLAEAACDPVGPSTGTFRVLRGGSWHDEATMCRSAVHGGDMPMSRGQNVGFRPSLSLSLESKPARAKRRARRPS